MGGVKVLSHPDQAAAILKVGIGARTLATEAESGDLPVIVPFTTGVLVAAIDGLGHGSEAATAAAAAASSMRSYTGGPLEILVRSCHHALRRTRGAALSLASFDSRSEMMTWLGVGNVEGWLFRANGPIRPAREYLLRRGGIVGYQMEALRTTTMPLFPGDTLIFATDGIDGEFSVQSPLERDPQECADDIVSRYSKPNDDALVVVARYLGSPR